MHVIIGKLVRTSFSQQSHSKVSEQTLTHVIIGKLVTSFSQQSITVNPYACYYW